MKENEIKHPKKKDVNADKLKPKPGYVCWIDIMGTRSMMSTSLATASNFILKFHASIIQAQKEEQVECYPLMDGVFITCPELLPLKKAINSIYNTIAKLFLEETLFEHKFIIRGAIAYGEIINGCDISEQACEAIYKKEDYRNTLLLGTPMIQAFEAESFAPPFGVYIHESARRYDNGLKGRYYQGIKQTKQLKEHIDNYFEDCQARLHYLNMKEEKIKLYKELTEEYFLICSGNNTKDKQATPRKKTTTRNSSDSISTLVKNA